MATANARSRAEWLPCRAPPCPRKGWTLRQGVDFGVTQIAWHDDDRNRKGADRVRHRTDDRTGTLRAGTGREHEHRNVDVLLDHVDHLLGRVTLADRAFRGYRGNAVDAAGCAVERRIRVLQRFGAHDVGHAQPLLVLVFGFDNAKHHHAAAGPHRPAAGIIDRAVPLRRVVNNNKTFWLVTGLVAASLDGHACPDASVAVQKSASLLLRVRHADFLTKATLEINKLL